MKTITLARCALFAAMALIIHVLESFIPPLLPIPGIKIGIANVITLAAVYILGNKEALFVLITRILLGNMFTGQALSLMYSLCGGVFCYIVTIALKRFFKGNTIWFLGVMGAVAHSIGQTLCAIILFDSISLVYYGALMCIVSYISGSFTGLCAQFMVKHFKTIKGKNK